MSAKAISVSAAAGTITVRRRRSWSRYGIVAVLLVSGLVMWGLGLADPGLGAGTASQGLPSGGV